MHEKSLPQASLTRLLIKAGDRLENMSGNTRAEQVVSIRVPCFGDIVGNLSTGRFGGNGNFSDRKSLGRKQRRSRQRRR